MTVPDPAVEPAPKPESLEVSLEYLSEEAGAVLSDPAISPNQLLTGVADRFSSRGQTPGESNALCR